MPKPIKRAVTHLQRIQFVSMVGQVSASGAARARNNLSRPLPSLPVAVAVTLARASTVSDSQLSHPTLQAAYLLYNSCAFPPRITITYAVYIISLFVLFTNFDRKTYGKPAAKKE